MKKYHLCLTAVVCLLIFALGRQPSDAALGDNQGTPVPMPEFTHSEPSDWINSPPLSLESLRGRVILIDFWTFECWNCYRSFPWLNQVESKFREKLVVIGVHSPEFDRERDRRRVSDKVKEFSLNHPIMIDNDFSYWNATGNRYWPAFYLVDKRGRLRYVSVGETHAGDRRAKAMEKRIVELLNETDLGLVQK